MGAISEKRNCCIKTFCNFHSTTKNSHILVLPSLFIYKIWNYKNYLFIQFRIAISTYKHNHKLNSLFADWQTHTWAPFSWITLYFKMCLLFLEIPFFSLSAFQISQLNLIFGGGSIPLSHFTMLLGDRNIISLIQKMQSVFLLFVFVFLL